MSFSAYQEKLIQRQMQGGAGYNVFDDDDFLQSLENPNDDFNSDMSFTPYQEQLIQRQMQGGVGYDVFEDQDFLTSLNPQESSDEGGFGSTALDIGQNLGASFGIGSNSLLTSIGGLYGYASGNYDNLLSRQGRRGIEYYESLKTPELKQKEADFQAYVDGGTNALDTARRAVWGTLRDPELLANVVVGTIPSAAVPGGAGALAVKGGVKGFGALSIGGATGAGLQAGGVADGVYNDMLSMPDDIWDGSPEFLSMADEVGRDEAKRLMAQSSARLAANISATISAGSMFLPDVVEKQVVKGVQGSNWLSRGVRGALSEGAQEAIEEGGGQLASNIGLRQINPDQMLFEGVPQAAGQGAVAGAAIGGLLGAASADARQNTIDQGGDDLDAAANAAGATADALDALRARTGIPSPPIIDGRIDLDPQPSPQDPPILPTTFEPQVLPDASFEPNRGIGASGINIPDLPFDLRDEILFADRMGRDEQAVQLRLAQQLYETARTTENARVAQRSLDRAREIIGRELPEEFTRGPAQPLEGDLLPTPRLSPNASPEEMGLGELVERTSDFLSSTALERPENIEADLRRQQQEVPRLGLDNAIPQPAPDYDKLVAGRSQNGFATRKGAEAALLSRSKSEPQYDWSIMPASGRYVLTGKLKERERTPLSVQLDRRREDESIAASMTPDQDRQTLADYYQLGDTLEMENALIRLEEDIEQLASSPGPKGATSADKVDLMTAIIRLGGLDSREAEAQGIDPASFTGVGRNRPFKRNGRSFDDMGEVLAENGFFAERPTANEVVDLVSEAVQTGERIYRGEGGKRQFELNQQADEIVTEIRSLEEEFGPISEDERQYLDLLYEESLNATYGEGQGQTPPLGGEARIEESSSPPLDEAVGRAPEARNQDLETEPQGSVSASGVPDFELESYTEADIATRERRDLDAAEARSQVDRERESFALEARNESIAATNDPLQAPQTSDLIGFSDVQPESNRDYGFESERTRLTAKLNGRDDANIDFILRDAGLQVKGTKQEKIERIVSTSEASFVLQNGGYESEEQIQEAVRRGDIDPRDMARWASGVTRTQESVSMPQSSTELAGSSKNTSIVAQTVTKITGGKWSVPYRTEAEQRAFEESPEQVEAMARFEEQGQARQEKDDARGAWFTANREGFNDWWGSASTEERRDLLEQAGALGDTERSATRRVNSNAPSNLPNEATLAIIDWGVRTGQTFGAAAQEAEQTASALTEEEYLDSLGQEEFLAEVAQKQIAVQSIEGGGSYGLLGVMDRVEIGELTLEEGKAEYKRILEREASRDVKGAVIEGKEKLPFVVREYDPLPENSRYSPSNLFLKNEIHNGLQVTRATGKVSRDRAAEILERWKKHAREQRGVTGPDGESNSQKLVISLFDYSGEWSQPWVDAGYQVARFDLQDGIDVEDMTNSTFWINSFSDFSNVYAVLAAPPCTAFSQAKTRYDKGWKKADANGETRAGQDMVQATLDIIEYLKPAIWAIENPKNSRIGSTVLGKNENNVTGLSVPALTFEHRTFGDPGAKPTSIWGPINANLPTAPIESAADEGVINKAGGKSKETMNVRSETPTGFAYAFFMANNAIDAGNNTQDRDWTKRWMALRYPGGHNEIVEELIDKGVTPAKIIETMDGSANWNEDNEQLAEDLRELMPDSDSPALFQAARGATRRPVISDEDFNAVMDRVVGPDADESVVRVVATAADLPQEIIDEAMKQLDSIHSVAGVFYKGAVYVVRNKMRSRGGLERLLLHEGTHGGIAAMYSNKEVTQKLNRVYAAMGGRKGFDKVAKQLGIEERLRQYQDNLGRSPYSQDVRNRILVEEMLAYTGEQGSKTLKLRVLEAIGAIRQWLRDKGFAALSRMRASDIALMAKNLRDDFMRSGYSSDTGKPSFATDGTRRAEVNEAGLYSNAEQTLLDEGGKIFKASKKNPEARVRGDQILSFLKGRGLKTDEERYTEIEEILTGEPGKRFTREEVIQQLRYGAPVLEEYVAERGPFEAEEGGSTWSEPEPQMDYAYYEHRVEDLVYEFDRTMGGYIDNYEIKRALDEFYAKPAHYQKIIESAKKNLDVTDEELAELTRRTSGGSYGFSTVRWLQSTYGIDDLTNAIKEDMEYEFNEVLAEIALFEYREDPVVRLELLNNDTVDGIIEGNESMGLSVQMTYPRGDGYKTETLTDIYSVAESKIQAEEWLRENGFLEPDFGRGIEVFGNFDDLPEETWDKYREIKMTTDGKWGTYSSYAGHFAEENVLYNVISTDRTTDLGRTLVAEEFQSDWHSDIRKAGGPRDPERVAEAELEKARLDLEKGRVADRVDELQAQMEDAFKALPDANEDAKTAGIEDGGGPLWAVLQSEMVLHGEEVIALDRLLTDAGRERFRSAGGPLNSRSARIFLSRLSPFAIQKYFDKDAWNARFGGTVNDGRQYIDSLKEFESLGGYDIADILVLQRGTEHYQDLMPWIEQAGAKDIAYELEDARRALTILGREASTASRNVRYTQKAPPEAPFGKDRYVELALKRMLITAVEEGKNALAWSTPDRLNRRWSSNYEYGQQYEKNIPKILKKLTGEDTVALDSEGEQVGLRSPDREFFAISISDEFKQEVTENGLPMFRLDDNAFPRQPIEETLADKFLRKFKDKFLPVLRVQERIQDETGDTLEGMNPYRAEELFYGKTEEDLRQIEVRFIKPFISAMERSGIEISELDAYLYALHAKERNRAIREKRTDMPENLRMTDGGSGMTDAEADEIVAAIEGSPKAAQFKNLANRIYQITRFTRELLVAGGLETEETVGAWKAEYTNYVPLKGWADDEVDGNGNRIVPRARTGQGFDIRGREAIPALGRSSKAASPTAQVIADLTEKVIRNRKNEVGKELLALVEAYPDFEQWNVYTEENPDTRMVGGADGKVRMVRLSAREMAADKDTYFAVKRDGKPYFIKMADRRLFEAMKNMGPQELDIVAKTLNPITRFLSSVNTSFNPQFLLTNGLRDIQAAALNMMAEATRDDGKLDGNAIAMKVVKGTPRAINAIRSANFDGALTLRDSVDDATDPDASEYRRYYQEFLDDGAKTGYFDSPDVTEIAKELESLLRSAGPGMVNNIKRAGRYIGDLVERYNLAVENGVRLSGYIEARKAGIDRKNAASLAKNMTVNFNRKGEFGAALNSYYMFFNAAIQGTLGQFARTVLYQPRNEDGSRNFNPRNLNLAQKLMAGTVVGSVAFAALMRGIGGEDDDGEAYWDKIPQGIRERNLVILLGEPELDEQGLVKPSSYIKLPLPYGFNFFWNLGDTTEAQFAGSRDRKQNLWSNLAGSAVTSFSPLPLHAGDSLAERSIMTVLPSVAVPLAEVAFNENYFGEKIAPENFPVGAQKANAELYYPSAKGPYKFISKTLNEATGGSRNKSGAIDISPEALEHIMESALGGIYRTGMGALDTVDRLTDERETPLARIPFARIVVGQDMSDYSDMDKFYRNRQEVINARDEYRKAETSEERAASDERFQGQRRLYARANSVDKQLRRLRDQRDRIRDDESLTPKEQELKLNANRQRMDKIVDRFNKQYEELLAR